LVADEARALHHGKFAKQFWKVNYDYYHLVNYGYELLNNWAKPWHSNPVPLDLRWNRRNVQRFYLLHLLSAITYWLIQDRKSVV
jgi:hypothetical protein